MMGWKLQPRWLDSHKTVSGKPGAVQERILEESGLRKGKEYHTQGSGLDITDEEGKRLRPDVVVQLPESKHLVIDSKVSLVSYEEFTGADDPDDRAKYASDLVGAVRGHVNDLNSKHYQIGKGMNSPDFVLLFMPIEASFAVALQTDDALFQFAWDKRVMIVTPTTLMSTLWTVASVWRQENQMRFAKDIARQSGALYDKLAGFVDTLQAIGTHIERTRSAYDTAMGQLSTGRGNLLGRAEKLKKLGVPTSKQIDSELLPIDKADSEVSIDDLSGSD